MEPTAPVVVVGVPRRTPIVVVGCTEVGTTRVVEVPGRTALRTAEVGTTRVVEVARRTTLWTLVMEVAGRRTTLWTLVVEVAGRRTALWPLVVEVAGRRSTLWTLLWRTRGSALRRRPAWATTTLNPWSRDTPRRGAGNA